MKYLKFFKHNSSYEVYKYENDFVVPNVSFIEEINTIHYNTKKPIYVDTTNAEVGDIAYCDENGNKFLAKSVNDIPYGSTPFGVVVIPSSHNVYGTGECAIVSLKHMNRFSATGESNKYIGPCWADEEFISTDIVEIPNRKNLILTKNEDYTSEDSLISGSYCCLPSDDFYVRYDGAEQSITDSLAYYRFVRSNYDIEYPDDGYIPSPYLNGDKNPEYYKNFKNSAYQNTLGDFNGKENTANICKIMSNNSPMCAAKACQVYYTVGTNPGDWYLPAAGELGYLVARLRTINNAIQSLNDSGKFNDTYYILYSLGDSWVGWDKGWLSSMEYATSTEYSENQCWVIDFYNGRVCTTTKSSNHQTVAFSRFII